MIQWLKRLPSKNNGEKKRDKTRTVFELFIHQVHSNNVYTVPIQFQNASVRCGVAISEFLLQILTSQLFFNASIL